MNNETAALICRVSTREQEDGYSLAAQENLLRDFCAKHGFEAPLILSFSETASKHTRRKKFHAFMAQVAKLKIRHIVVEKVDRLTRSGLKEAVMIDDWLEADENRYLHCVKDGIDLHKYSRSGDKLNWGMRVVLAKNYTDNLREEIRKVTDTMLRRGIWPQRAPIGYIHDKSNPKCPLKPDPVRSKLIQRIFDLYKTGETSVQKLEVQLYEEGFRTSKGNRVRSSQIHRILEDPIYMGKMRFDKKIWDGVHTPLISAEVFEQVQRRIRRKSSGKESTRFQHHNHVYRGLASCSDCGKPLTWEIQKGRTYGYCRHRHCSVRTSIREDKLERDLIPHLAVFRAGSPRFIELLRSFLKQDNATEQTRHESTKAELDHLLTKVEQRLSRLLDMRIDDLISEADFHLKREELGKEKELVLKRLSQSSERRDSYLDDVGTLVGLTQNAVEQFESATSERKRTIVKLIFQNLTVSSTEVTIEYTNMFRYLSAAMVEVKSSKVGIFSPDEELIFEPEESGSGKNKVDDSIRNHPLWWGSMDDVRTLFGMSPAWNSLVDQVKNMSSETMQLALSALADEPEVVLTQPMIQATCPSD